MIRRTGIILDDSDPGDGTSFFQPFRATFAHLCKPDVVIGQDVFHAFMCPNELRMSTWINEKLIWLSTQE